MVPWFLEAPLVSQEVKGVHLGASSLFSLHPPLFYTLKVGGELINMTSHPGLSGTEGFPGHGTFRAKTGEVPGRQG